MPSFSSPRVMARALLGLVLGFAVSMPCRADDEAAASAPSASQDYYSRRAREILKQDEAQNAPAPHPLAAAYPRHSVVVCEAGCRTSSEAEVVFMEKLTAQSASARAAGSAGTRTATIDCVGGCYDTPRRYPVPRSVGRAPWQGHPPAMTPGGAEKRGPFDPRY